MKRHYGIRLSLLAALCLATAARADIVTLKSGEKMEGRILSETPESIEMEYRLTPKIKDKKTVLKSDIKEIKRQTAAELEFEEKGLKGILPTPDLMPASDYEAIIQDKLRRFRRQVSRTPLETAEVEKDDRPPWPMEKSKVLSGITGEDGRPEWLDAATTKRETYNIEAYRQYLFMKSKAGGEHYDMHYLNALRAFDKLRNEYGASAYFTLAIPEALDLLKKYESQLNGMINDAPILLKKREDGLKTMNPSDAAIAKRANDDEMKGYKAALDIQTKNKTKWKNINKYDAKGLQDALATVLKERAELQALDLTSLAKENSTIMSIIRFLADGNAPEARALFDKINKDPTLVNRGMMTGLLKQIDLRQKEMTTAARTQRGAAVADVPSPTNKDDGAAVNPVKAEMDRVKAEKEKAAAAKKAGAAGATKPADGSANPGDRKPATPAAAAPAEEEGGGIMGMITENIPYIGGGLLLIILLIWFLSRKKKD